MTTLQSYYNLLDLHDWYYDFSDDHFVWSRGADVHALITKISAESLAHTNLYLEFKKHFFSGEPWSTPKHPKPERPKEG